jgi:translation initiation factor 3 subunit E
LTSSKSYNHPEKSSHFEQSLIISFHRDLSTRLGLSQDEGEKWIVNLIRDTRVDAKIDYKAGTVIMNHPPMSVYQQVIERTKGGFFRTQVLSAAVAK